MEYRVTACQSSCNGPPPQQYAGTNSQQLGRSKSLNDISDDSQISAFASNRLIKIHNTNNYSNNEFDLCNGKNANNFSCMSTDDQNRIILCQSNNASNDRYNYQYQSPQNHHHFINPTSDWSNQSNNLANHPYGNQTFDTTEFENLNNNGINMQCSRIAEPLAPGNSNMNGNNMFNSCNQTALNPLNGLAEQIGNLQL